MRSEVRIALAGIGLAFLVGCAARNESTPIYQRQARFVQEEYDPFAVAGTASVSGQTFLKTQGGDVKYGAGNDVILTPVTSYSHEWMDVRVIKDQAISPPDPRVERFFHSTLADGEGRFRFDNLPKGDYFLACYITWKVPGLDGPVSTGGWAYTTAKVDSGAKQQIILTQPDLTTVGRFVSNESAPLGSTLKPLGTPYTVRMETGQVIGAKEVFLQGGLLRVISPDGQARNVNPARVSRIVDAQGNDWTLAVFDEGKHLKANEH